MPFVKILSTRRRKGAKNAEFHMYFNNIVFASPASLRLRVEVLKSGKTRRQASSFHLMEQPMLGICSAGPRPVSAT